MPEFQFLVSFMGKQQNLKTITSYFRGLSNFKEFHEKQKCIFLGNSAVLFVKTKTASMHTGAGRYRETKIRVKTLPAMMGF